MVVEYKSQDYPAIQGYVFHHTSIENALKILEDGYLKPSAGSVSFTLDPCFGSTVSPGGVTFVFLESVIKQKYLGKEPYFGYYPDEEARKIWEREMEIEVEGRLIYIADCIEILGERDACRFYGYGWKYHYLDIRDRRYEPWIKFNKFRV